MVKLAIMFTRSAIPSNRSQIPKPEVAASWEHLNVIVDKMVPYHQDVEVSLLIGSNCPRVVRPRESLLEERMIPMDRDPCWAGE